MYIRCQSCGQLLYIPDDANGKTVRCPACQTEFVYTAEEPTAREEENRSEEPSSQVEESLSPAEEPLPEFAARESYHQPRNLKLQPFLSLDAMFTAYRLFSEHFGVLLLFAILTIIPSGLANWAQFTLIPELSSLQSSLAEKETFEEAYRAYQEIFQSISALKILAIIGINLISLLLTMCLNIGGIRLFNAYGRKQKASFGLTLSGFDSFGRVFLACFLMYILIFALSFVGSFVIIAMSVAGLAALGFFLFLCLMILLFVYIFFVLPLIADSNLSASKAFQLSYIIAKRNISTLFGTISLLIFMMLIINIFVMSILGSVLTNVLSGLIAQALFQPLFVGVLSVAYLKATGQFKQ